MNAVQAIINFALQFVKEFADEMLSISCSILCMFVWVGICVFAHPHCLLSTGHLGVHAAEPEKQDVAVSVSHVCVPCP